jgi:hypothetical protein
MKREISTGLVAIQKFLLSAKANAPALMKYYCSKEAFKKNPLSFVLFSGLTSLLILSMFITPKGRIIPLGPEMIAAYDLLQTTNSGRSLIKTVRKSTRGTIVYMILGTTKDNYLLDYPGLQVRGITRTRFNSFDNNHVPAGITIFTNKDITEGLPNEIVKNIAFELENVIHSMKYPGIEFGKDSPYASTTQQLVCMELGL